MTDREILIWIHQRLVLVHGESEYVDYMHRLREVIGRIPDGKKTRLGAATSLSMNVLDEIRYPALRRTTRAGFWARVWRRNE